MKAVLDAVGTYVSTMGFGTLGTNLFLDTLPGTPYSCVGVFQYGGIRIEGDPLRRMDFQVKVRNSDHTAAATKVSSLYAIFDRKWCCLSPTFNGNFQCLSEISEKRVDENHHAVYTFIVEYKSVFV